MVEMELETLDDLVEQKEPMRVGCHVAKAPMLLILVMLPELLEALKHSIQNCLQWNLQNLLTLSEP